LASRTDDVRIWTTANAYYRKVNKSSRGQQMPHTIVYIPRAARLNLPRPLVIARRKVHK
jgi:hypothetical protein